MPGTTNEITPAAPRGLIKQTKVEMLLARRRQILQDLARRRAEQQAAEKQAKVSRLERAFVADFLSLAEKYFKLSAEELRADYDRADLADITRLIQKEAWREQRSDNLICLCIPVVGWCLLVYCLFLTSESRGAGNIDNYLIRYRRLRRMFGKNYSPYDALHPESKERGT